MFEAFPQGYFSFCLGLDWGLLFRRFGYTGMLRRILLWVGCGVEVRWLWYFCVVRASRVFDTGMIRSCFHTKSVCGVFLLGLRWVSGFLGGGVEAGSGRL